MNFNADDYTLDAYRKKITNHSCVTCGTNLDTENADFDHYDHDGGWLVWTGTRTECGIWKKWWLSIRCEKCGYENSLTKLGVPQNAHFFVGGHSAASAGLIKKVK